MQIYAVQIHTQRGAKRLAQRGNFIIWIQRSLNIKAERVYIQKQIRVAS